MAMKNNMIYPCLWFDGKAKEAADFYCSVFDNSAITYENQMIVIFESSGQKFMCLNSGPEFIINPSVSFYVLCETEEEIDRLWKNLLEGGMRFSHISQGQSAGKGPGEGLRNKEDEQNISKLFKEFIIFANQTYGSPSPRLRRTRSVNRVAR
jgi:uncharacterized glyoxalase superfamily protein PhnB